MYFSEIAARGVLWKILQKKKKKIHNETPVPESFFDKISNFL